MPLRPERKLNVDARFWTLRSFGFDAKTAHEVALVLEYRCLCHERVGGVEVIYDELWMEHEAHRWAGLYRRAVAFLEPKHVERLRAVLDRLAISVCVDDRTDDAPAPCARAEVAESLAGA